MKHKVYPASVATLIFGTMLSAQTMPKTASSPSVSPSDSASPAAPQAKTAMRPFPFHGMVSAVDQKAKTFTMAGKGMSRIFKITDNSAITKSGKPAMIKDIVENEEVSGSYWKNADGTLEAKTVKLGPMEKATISTASPAASAKASASSKAPASPKP